VTRLTAVVDDYALGVLPGLDRDLHQAGVAVLRCFDRLPSPAVLRSLPALQGVAVLGGADLASLRARLETATATLAAPVVAVLPPGEVARPELRGPGVVDLIPAWTRSAAERVVLMSRVPIVSVAGRRAAPLPPPRSPPRPGPAATTTETGAARARPDRVLAIASSTGGVWVLAGLLQAYGPRSTSCALVAQHMDAEFVAFFAEWLASTTPWVTVLVEGAQPLEPGRLYLAAGGHDLVAEGDQVAAVPTQSRYVPCADRLFRSVAAAHGPRARAAVLSGMGADGAEGLAEVARRGGRIVCQTPGSAVVPSMPESALRRSPWAELAPPALLAAVLGRD
jgi:two-component system chemotaxis response regulator CheB